jgi:hypothetical protein
VAPPQSTGFDSAVAFGVMALSAATVPAARGSSTSPRSASASAACEITPPPSDSTATRRVGFPPWRDRRSATGNISSERSTTVTPAWRSTPLPTA